MDNTVGRLQSLFPPHQFDVMIGSLLGDARLECRSKGLRYPISARLRIHQSEKQKEIEPFIIPSMIYKICNPRNDLFNVKNIGQIERAGLFL